MKKLFAILLAGLMIVSFAACSDKDENENDLDAYVQEDVVIDFYTNEKGETFKFDSLDSETITITGYKGGDVPHAVEIPSTMHDKTVAGISDQAFYSLSNITEIKIPSTVTFIGSMAFAECRQLTAITIPAGVEEIGEAAFMRCSSLKSITFEAGSKLTALPLSAFKECKSLESVTVPANIKSIGKAAFQDCFALKTVVLEEGVESLGVQAFQNCKALESLTLPATLKTIEGFDEAENLFASFNFTGCDALYIEGVKLPADANSVAAKYIAKLNLQNKPAEETPAA